MRATRLEHQVAVRARTRPIRVCYMLEDHADASEILTEIFAESYARWRGVDTLIVPVVAGKVDDRYLAWLRSFDPDILYSYCDLSEELVIHVDRLCMPPILQRHPDKEIGGRKQLWPSWPLFHLEPVHNFSVLPALKLSRGALSPGPALIVDAYPEWHGDGFVTDSFGIRSSSSGRTLVWPMDAQVRDYVASLALTPPDAPPNRWQYPKAETEVTSEAELLQRMTTDATIVTMAQLASAFSELNVPYTNHPWANSLNLVVGDSMVDRLSFWNGRLLNQLWQQDGLTAMRIPTARLGDDGFLEAITAFIARRNWITPGGQSGSGHVTIRSASIDAPELMPLRDRLRAATHSQINVELIESAFDCVPAPEHLTPLQRWTSRRPTQFVSETKFSLDCPPPRHIAELASVPPNLRTGHWAVDVRIERHNTQSPFINVSHWWQLPRRWQMLRAFSEERYSKINLDGEPRLFRSIDGPSKELRLPEDIEAIQHFFLDDPLTRDRRGPSHKQTYQFTAPGDKGRYLIGALELFGNLASAFRVLSNRFCQKRFAEMAAPARNLSDEKRDARMLRLKMYMTRRANTTDITSDSNWDGLAEAVARIAPGAFKNPRPIGTYEDLLRERHSDFAELKNLDPNLEGVAAEIKEECELDLRRAIERRCLEGVLAQGHRWRCYHCGHRNWVSVAAVGPVLKCDVCGGPKPFPANFQRDFSLNELFAEGLREHGLLGMIWALGHIQDEASNCFFFAPPLALYRKYPERRSDPRDAEIDICCVADGVFIIGEVKESSRDINNDLGDSLVVRATEVRPDRVVIACLDRSAQNTLNAQAHRIRNSLQTIGCAVEAIVPDTLFGQGSTSVPSAIMTLPTH